MVKRFKVPVSMEKASIVSPEKPFVAQGNFVSPDPDDPVASDSVLTTQVSVNAGSSADVETFQLRPEDIEIWNPSQHPMDAEVVFYEPGSKLVYEQRHDLTPIVARFVGALILGWLIGLFFKEIQWSVITALSLVGVVELLRWKTGRYESIRWEWDWHRQSLREIAGEDRFEYKFSEIREIILKLTKLEHKWSSALSGNHRRNRFYSFNAHTLISGPEDDVFEVARTGYLQQHPDEVKYLGLCFAFMLAQELNVPLRIQELPSPD